jgi:monofunctional chorismate mutase
MNDKNERKDFELLEPKVDVLRKEIDKIDKQLMELLKERFSYATEIAEIKQAMGTELYDPDRESNILRQLSMKIGDHESLIEILSVFESLLQLSKKAQNKHLNALKK